MKLKKNRISNYILIVAGVVFLLTGILIYPYIKLLATGTKTVGVVTNMDSDLYSVKAQYDCGSKKGIIGYRIGYRIGNSSMISSSYNYRIGDQIEIYCAEENPEIFVSKEFSNYFLILFPLSGLFMLGFGIKKEKLRQELIKNGIKVEATITSITQAWWSQQINNQEWYTITAKYGDDTFVSKNAHVSKNIFENTNNIVKEGEKIDVYLDAGDHSKYWMDIDSIFEKLDDNNSINN